MPCVYVLYSQKQQKFYIGSSREEQPDDRLKAHNAGKTRSTKAGRPWELVHKERTEDYTAARKRENFLKTGQGRKQVKEIFNRRA